MPLEENEVSLLAYEALNPDSIRAITDPSLVASKLAALEAKAASMSWKPTSELKKVELKVRQGVLSGREEKAVRKQVYTETVNLLLGNEQRFGQFSDSKSLRYQLDHEVRKIDFKAPADTRDHDALVEGVFPDFLDPDDAEKTALSSAAQAENILKALKAKDDLFGLSEHRRKVRAVLQKRKIGMELAAART